MTFENIWCWLIPLLVGAICALIGYYWGKGKREVIDHTHELDELKGRNAKLTADLDRSSLDLDRLRADLDLCQKNLLDAKTNITIPKPDVDLGVSNFAASVPPVALIPFDADAAKAVFGKRIRQDDLKIVEGIGPKIEGLFKDRGINTWKTLSDTAVERLQKILDDGGPRYRVHEPDSWPMQAKMAYEGRWEELLKWQDEHKGGKFS